MEWLLGSMIEQIRISSEGRESGRTGYIERRYRHEYVGVGIAFGYDYRKRNHSF